MRGRKTKLILLWGLFFSALVFIFVLGAHTLPVHAGPSLDFPRNFADFSTAGLKGIIENIVRIVLGFVGVIFLLLLLYGGFVWMTSGGSPDKINRAKKIIASAIIGLIITLSSYAIAGFIISRLGAAVGGSSSGPGPTCTATCGNGTVECSEQCDGQPGCSLLSCTWFNSIPGCPPPANGTDVKVCPVSGTINKTEAVTIQGYNFGNYGPGSEVKIDNVHADLVMCGGTPNWSMNPVVPHSSTVVVIVPDGASTGPNKNVYVHSDTGQDCASSASCTTTTIGTGTSPYIRCMTPTSGGVTTAVQLDGKNFGPQPPGGDVQMYNGSVLANIPPANITQWTDDTINFTVPAPPVTVYSGNVRIKNGTTSLYSNQVPFTLTCPAPGSAAFAACTSGCCVADTPNQCRLASVCAATSTAPNAPVITQVTPDNGAPGNYITIWGRNFGTSVDGPNGLPGDADDSKLTFTAFNSVPFVNPFPGGCSASAIWADNQIIMQIPATAVSGLGSVQVQTVPAGSPLNSNPKDLTVNTISRPGLCAVTFPSPAQGPFGTAFGVFGTNLNGPTSGTKEHRLYFGRNASTVSANNTSVINNTTANGTVPNIVAGQNSISLYYDSNKNDGSCGPTPACALNLTKTACVGVAGCAWNDPTPGQDSNPVAFRVDATPTGDPVVTDVSPHNGPTGTYLTILGNNFGPPIGQVVFVDKNDSTKKYGADTVFPAVCSTSWWFNDHIIVKVPDNDNGVPVPLGDYWLQVITKGTPGNPGKPSTPSTYTFGTNDFKKDTTPLAPGLCRINPLGGPIGTPVDYYGENFGLVRGAGNVFFHNGLPVASFGSWGNQTIGGAIVPPNAVNGLTYVNQNTRNSNKLPFLVGACTQYSQCGNPTQVACCSGICRQCPVTGCINTPADCGNTLNYGENNWIFTSGQLPFDIDDNYQCTLNPQSPTPFPYAQYIPYAGGPTPPAYGGGDPETNAPTSAVVAARFNREIDFDSIADPVGVGTGNIRVYQCVGGPGWPGSGACTGNRIDTGGRFAQLGGNGFQWQLMPVGTNLLPDTWYEVRLDDPDGTVASDVLDILGDHYKGSAFLGNVGTTAGFRWHFKTRTSALDRCEINSLRTTPASGHYPPPDRIVGVGATSGSISAVPTNAQCYICGGNYNYSWTIQPNNADAGGTKPFAEFAPAGTYGPGPLSRWGLDNDDQSPTGSTVQFYGRNLSPDQLTNANPLNITVRLMNPPSGGPISSAPPISTLSVRNIPPRVISYSPNAQCINFCTNGIPYARFNQTVVDPPSLSKVELHLCSGSLCNDVWGAATRVTATTAFSTYTVTDDQINLTPTGCGSPPCPLLPNRFYRVIVRGLATGIKNALGQNLDLSSAGAQAYDSGSGASDSFSWIFKTGGGQCSPTALNVTPDNATITTFGGTQNYSGHLTAPACKGTVNVNPAPFSWSWISSLTTVATIPNTNSASQKATCKQAGGSGTTSITGSIASPALSDGLNQLTCSDTRAAINFIGHRPEMHNFSPPEVSGDNPNACDLIGGLAGAAQCALPCRNIAISAFFDNNVAYSSVRTDPQPNPNFQVIDLTTNQPVPGSIKVSNYTSSPGVCSNNQTIGCTDNTPCAAGGGSCVFKKGRINFYPKLQQAVTSGLALHYDFNGGVATDLSGNGNNGTLNNGAVAFGPDPAMPALGKGIQFDGINDYVVAPHNASLNLPGPIQNVTITAWIKAGISKKVPQYWQAIAGKRNGSINWYRLAIKPSGVLSLEIAEAYGPPAINTNTADSVKFVTDNVWHHVAGVKQGGQLRVYIDGVQDGPTTATTFTNLNNLDHFMVGDYTTGATNPFNGIIDDVRVYTRALSAGEIGIIRKEGLGSPIAFENIFAPNTEYEVRLCDGVTCASPNAITSTEGVEYTLNKRWAFTTGGGLCRISFVTVDPNPADFNDIQHQCLAPNPSPQCLDAPGYANPKPVYAQAHDSSGLDLTDVRYTWRETKDVNPANGYDSSFYKLQKVGAPPDNIQANTWQRGKVGVDNNEVSAVSDRYCVNNPATPCLSNTDCPAVGDSCGGVDLGYASTQGRMHFYFCANPWFGDPAFTSNPYYLDQRYDVQLGYCRDTSDINNPLPSLPIPHIIREPAVAGNTGDLLREHVFIVGGPAGPAVPGTYNNTPPAYTNPALMTLPPQPTPPPPVTKYRYGDLVNFKLDAKDAEGDSFLYTLQGRCSNSPATVCTTETATTLCGAANFCQLGSEGAGGDVLPSSASFNQRTGVFSWVIDKLPTTDSAADGDTEKDFDITFGLNPSGNTKRVTINVDAQTPPTSPPKPTVTVIAPPAGPTTNIAYGGTVNFNVSASCPTGCKTYLWDFQDSGTSSYAGTYTASHIFLQSGLHQVSFRVQDNNNAWSNPAVWNVIVAPRTSLAPASVHIASVSNPNILTRLVRGAKTWFFTTVFGQSAVSSPTNFVVEALGTQSAGTLANRLTWTNRGPYDAANGIKIYRTSNAVTTIFLQGGTTTFKNDSPVTIGTDYTYKVCGVVGGVESCTTEITWRTRNADYDVIAMRVFKNTTLLSVSEWYRRYAPNPVGSPLRIIIDGYEAIQDGTSVYIGAASCIVTNTANPTPELQTCSSRISANIIFLSYNAGAKPSTVTIFNQMLQNLKINDELITRWDGTTPTSYVCSADSTIDCTTGYDAMCASRNAGICKSPKAELRRDLKRIVSLHDIVSHVYTYGQTNLFCNDGSNSQRCTKDADCRVGYSCLPSYPTLSAGTYIGGLTTSKWPSWDQNLGSALKMTMPVDPIDKFGTGFYASPPTNSCKDFANFNVDTCWNERTSQFQCHSGSEVFMYKVQNGTSFKVYGLTEGQGNWTWPAKDPNVIVDQPGYGGICNSAPAVGVCGNGVIERRCSGGPTPNAVCSKNADCGAGGTCAGEVCDGGTANYCDVNNPGPDRNWNTDFPVGCNAGCTGWGGPAPYNPALCNGYCGDLSRQALYEGCDPPGSTPAGSCTLSGALYCSSTCQLACTQGHPYGGTCGANGVEAGEVCDDGANNGRPGYCNSSCSGYGSFCGDGVLTPIDAKDAVCACDNAVPACTSGYQQVQGATCSAVCSPVATPAHQWSCVANVEECDGVVGLTSYSCPSSRSLTCGGDCRRVCSNVDSVAATGNRNASNIPLYESFSSQSEDYTYGMSAQPNDQFVGKGIMTYMYAANAGACPAADAYGRALRPLYLYNFDNGVISDHYLDLLNNDSRYGSVPPRTVIGCVYQRDYSAAIHRGRCRGATGTQCDTDSQCGATGPCDNSAVPVYAFTTNHAAGTDQDIYYSRSDIPRTDVQGNVYIPWGSNKKCTDPVTKRDNGGAFCTSDSQCTTTPFTICHDLPAFYALLGPLQETCGNDVVEGLEQCEPGTYQTPQPQQSNPYKQYQCGALGTPNQCRTYGGYCGDGQPVSGLVGWWGFNNGSATIASDGSGRAPLKDGVITGAIPTAADATVSGLGRGLQFNGAADVKITSDVKFDMGPSGIAYSVWFKTSMATAGRLNRLINKYACCASLTGVFLSMNSAGSISEALLAWGSGGAQRINVNAGSGLNDNKWHHAVLQINRGTGNGELYIDGALGNSKPFPAANHVNVGTDISIGKWPGAADPFIGSIDDVRIYNRSLTTAEISEMYAEGLGRKQSAESCDEGTANKCISSTGIINPGVVKCLSDTDCAPPHCSITTTTSCRANSDCPTSETCATEQCLGNGAKCNNTISNCSYCTSSCQQGLLPRNYCGDGIVNCGRDGNCAVFDAFQEICDDGTNNGLANHCNETCSGLTGSICGNGGPLEKYCSEELSNDCVTRCTGGGNQICTFNSDCPAGQTCSLSDSDPASPAPQACPGATGYCSGEKCDDGALNGKVSKSCSLAPNAHCNTVCTQNNAGDPYTLCQVDSDCPAGVVTNTCTVIDADGNPFASPASGGAACGTCGVPYKPYCSNSCQGPTAPYCGDGIVESPNAGPDNRMVCANNASRQCLGEADCSPTDGPGVCLNGTNNGTSCTSSANCTGGGTCRYCNVDGVNETCDFGSRNGQPGYCNATCNGVTPGICGDGIPQTFCSANPTIRCNFGQAGDDQCDVADDGNQANNSSSCTSGEQCDLGSGVNSDTPQTATCTDSGGNEGLRQVGCSPSCGNLTTACNAYGLRVWSDGTDVAYINGVPIGSTFGSGGVVTGTATTNTVEAVALDTTNNVLFIAGSGDGADANKWRIEKRSMTSGALCKAGACGGGQDFDTDGIIIEGSTNWTPHDLVLDTANNAFFITGTAAGAFRTEKRQMSDGHLCDGTLDTASGTYYCNSSSAFGTGGFIVHDGKTQWAYTVIVDGPSVFIGGEARYGSTTYSHWWIEKRNVLTGALDGAFNASHNNGPTTGIYVGPNRGDIDAYDMAIDAASLYMIGSRGGTPEWSYEKINKSTGEIETAFGTNGLVSPGYSREGHAIAADGTRVYGVGQYTARGWYFEIRDKGTGARLNFTSLMSASGGTTYAQDLALNDPVAPTWMYVFVVDNGIWRIKKLSTANLSVDNTFGTNGTMTADTVTNLPGAIVLDTVNGFFYVVGSDDSNNWRIEKRILGNGQLQGAGAADQTTRLTTLSAGTCTIDPSPNGATYIPPTLESGGACAAGSANDVVWSTNPSQIRPNPADASVQSWERDGKNVIAIKVWVGAAGTNRSFQAVYTSPIASGFSATTAGAGSDWICSNTYTKGWDTLDCPDSDGNGYSDCDPYGGDCVGGANIGQSCGSNTECPGSTCQRIPQWRTPYSYTNDAANPRCATNYTNFAGGSAQWVWGPSCAAANTVVYCRLEFGVDLQGANTYAAGESCGDGIPNGPELGPNGCDQGAANGTCGTSGVTCSTQCGICTGGTSSSFVAGTMVVTPQGLKDIKDLQKNDTVVGMDLTTKQLKELSVVERRVSTSNHYYLINHTLKVSGEHPFAVKTDEGMLVWKKVKDLIRGDKLLSYGGNIRRIEAIEKYHTPAGGVTVYNPQVSEPNDYFVIIEGNLPILAHNKVVVGGGGLGGCFVAGTQVLTPGGTKSIESLAVGDAVISYDPVANKQVVAHVTKPFTVLRDHYYLINGGLKVTAEHRFAIQSSVGLIWKEVQNLQQGDVMIGERQLIVVRSIQRFNLEEPIEVYNPEMSEPHTYYVDVSGQGPVLVHNMKRQSP